MQKNTFFRLQMKQAKYFFDNLEPRNYWFRIIKDTLSNESTTVRTLRALPRDAEINTIMAVGIE